MWVRAQRRMPDVLPGLHIEAGERVLVEVSRKFTPEGARLNCRRSSCSAV